MPVTFSVDDVAINTSPAATCKPSEAVRLLLDTPAASEDCHTACRRIEACWDDTLDCVAEIGYHPLVAAAHLAFSEHRPLVLSPDVIWVTVVQGLAQHIRLDPEAHRNLLVRHKGKKELIIKRNDLHIGDPKIPWDLAAAELALMLRQETGELAEGLVCDFSTTGPVERTVSEIALLDVFQPYFNYIVMSICGIPSVTLEGTPTDWLRLREKVELLASFGLNWWLSELRPICDQFARAAAGDIDLQHWQRIYKLRAVYGGEIINGWLGKLFPYTKDFKTHKFSHRNDLLDPKVEEKICRMEAVERRHKPKGDIPYDDAAPGIRTDELPRGLSQVPFTFIDITTDVKTAMEFIAGPIAVTQNSETGALRPTLGWAVCEPAMIEQAMMRLAEHEIKPTDIESLKQKLNPLKTSYVPAEMFRFYSAAEEALIFEEGRQQICRVLPIEEWKNRETKKWGFKDSHSVQFAELSDSTEILLRVYSWEKNEQGAVFVGCRSDGTSAPDTGRKIAQSFAEFLFHALDCGSGMYFRRAGFAPLT